MNKAKRGETGHERMKNFIPIGLNGGAKGEKKKTEKLNPQRRKEEEDKETVKMSSR